MAIEQNLFDKYGIKEVADVTFYRIEKKEETYEAHREITVASILKGAIELQDVYPLNEQGVGSEDGFKAYVFKDADIIHGINYDCDDIKLIREVYTITFKTKNESLTDEPAQFGHEKLEQALESFTKGTNNGLNWPNVNDRILKFVKKQYDPETGYGIVKSDLDGFSFYKEAGTKNNGNDEVPYKNTEAKPIFRKIKDLTGTGEDGFIAEYTATFNVLTVYKNDIEMTTGIFKTEQPVKKSSQNNITPDIERIPGTHEYTYPEQVCMLFATRQNLITKTGTRYQFKEANEMFGDITFNDNFSSTPYSTERIVVVGIAGKMTEETYDIEEVAEEIKKLTTTYTAKGYDVIYNDYAELVVEDEMGYFDPAFLGYDFKREHGLGAISFFKSKATNDNKKNGNEKVVYKNWAKERKGVDMAISAANMWDEGVHYSINDAIDALRQKQKVLDANTEDGVAGIRSIFGGYRVSWRKKNGELSVIPGDDDIDENRYYDFSANGEKIQEDEQDIKSQYPLEDTENAVREIGYLNAAIDKDLRVDAHGVRSNRAIYIRVDGMVDTSAGAFIYLLHNKNYRKLALDKEGIFEFEDKKGNTLYYQDKIFCGVEWLALVIIGDKGLIFVVNRHGKTDTERIGWMINQNGYVTDSQACRLSKNGLIHTTDITVNNETFQATCTVKSLKTHKTKKRTDHYVPVLFLDTLKISTIEQTAEEVYATGGRGNANLIGWDFGKEITLSLEDALFTPASMSAMFGSYEGNDFRKGVKEVKHLDRFEKVVAKRSFIVPPGNMNGTPTEANKTAQAVFYDPNTMEPYPDGTPIAEGELFYKFTRSVAYEGQSLGHMIEISADKFPGTYRVVGDTYVRSKANGEDERFQFIICQAKMSSEQTITLEADGDPAVNNIQSNAAVKIA